MVTFDNSRKSNTGKFIPLVERTDSLGQKTLEPHECPFRDSQQQITTTTRHQPQQKQQQQEQQQEGGGEEEWRTGVMKTLAEISFTLTGLRDEIQRLKEQQQQQQQQQQH